MLAGGGECLSASYPQYLQCAFGVSNFLAHLCYHGSTAFCWKISQGELQDIFSYTDVTRYTEGTLDTFPLSHSLNIFYCITVRFIVIPNDILLTIYVVTVILDLSPCTR